MKLSAFVAAAAVIGGSFLIPVPAEARNGWMFIGHNSQSNVSHYVKPIGGGWPYRLYMDNAGSEPLKAEADCQSWRTRWVNPGGRRTAWNDVMPQSWGESKMKVVCR